MATWQPSVNSGGFLGSIGQFNDNAPRASDANPVINSINQSNELARSGANNMGLQALNGLVGLAGIYQENKAKERLGEFQKAWGEAYANSDRDGMRQLLATYPEYAQMIDGGMKGINGDVKEALGNLSLGYSAAVNSGNVEAYVRQNADNFRRVGIDPQEALKAAEQDPQEAVKFAKHLGYQAIGFEKFSELEDKQLGRQIDQGRLDEQIRSNQAGEALTREGHQIQVRGQNISAQNSMRSASSAGSKPASVQEYEYMQSLSPEQRKQFMQLKGKAGMEMKPAQLSNGMTAMIDPTPYGAGDSKYYRGMDANGNMITVPVNALSSVSDPSGNAGKNLMNSDIEMIKNASDEKLKSITGLTGGVGTEPLTADISTRFSGGEERELYSAAKRIQGYMQNQGIGAARAMGASGINTVQEARMFFQSMPQLDMSSTESLRKSNLAIEKYVADYNARNNANLGSPTSQKPTQQAPQSAIQALKQNPSLAPQFKAKYGYLP